jgi:2-isopropylmalate synthase
VVDHTTGREVIAQATVKVHVAGERVIATAEGNGPINALDGALRQALGAHVPWLATVVLSDYKVRILPGTHGTDAVTRVLVDTSDGTGAWTTVGVHGNVVEASWLALLDAMTYAALRHDGVASAT